MKLIDNASGNVSKGITLDSTNKADSYKLSYNCSSIGNGKSYIRIYATVIEGYKTYFMPIQFTGIVEFELSFDNEAIFLQFDVLGNATIQEINLEGIVDATMQYVQENSKYWDKIKEIVNSTGKLRSELLEGIINTSLNKIMAPGYLNEGNVSIWETETEATMINPDGMYRANSKKADGSWDWKPFTVGAGINADAIVAGILRAIEISGVNITGSTMKTGSLIGVTIEGSTIYAGDRSTGNYAEINTDGVIHCYTNNLRTISLVRRPNGIIDIGRDIDAKNFMRISSDTSVTIDGTNVEEGMGIRTQNGAQLIFDTQGSRIIFNGDIFCTGRVVKEWNGGFKTGDYVEL